jgi:hypothetical protein
MASTSYSGDRLTRDAFNRPDGAIFTGAPPLRDQTDRDYLWAAIARGSVDAVNTDHVGYTRAEKMDPGGSVQRPREGANFLQDQMPLLYSEGVRKGRISLERMVAVTATNPAKLFGLYPGGSRFSPAGRLRAGPSSPYAAARWCTRTGRSRRHRAADGWLRARGGSGRRFSPRRLVPNGLPHERAVRAAWGARLTIRSMSGVWRQ